MFPTYIKLCLYQSMTRCFTRTPANKNKLLQIKRVKKRGGYEHRGEGDHSKLWNLNLFCSQLLCDLIEIIYSGSCYIQYVNFFYCKMPNLLIWRGRGYFSNMGMHLLIILCFSMFLSFNHLLFLSFFPFFFSYSSLSLLSITINRFPISAFLSSCPYSMYLYILLSSPDSSPYLFPYIFSVSPFYQLLFT